MGFVYLDQGVTVNPKGDFLRLDLGSAPQAVIPAGASSSDGSRVVKKETKKLLLRFQILPPGFSSKMAPIGGSRSHQVSVVAQTWWRKVLVSYIYGSALIKQVFYDFPPVMVCGHSDYMSFSCIDHV